MHVMKEFHEAADHALLGVIVIVHPMFAWMVFVLCYVGNKIA